MLFHVKFHVGFLSVDIRHLHHIILISFHGQPAYGCAFRTCFLRHQHATDRIDFHRSQAAHRRSHDHFTGTHGIDRKLITGFFFLFKPRPRRHDVITPVLVRAHRDFHTVVKCGTNLRQRIV